ncbi:MAG: RsmE family RNA methyltransferase [Ruthenibacterium lactatiformans]
MAAPKKEEQKNLRYNRIAFEAAKQSGRGVVPQVELPVTYKQMLADAARNDAAFFCYEAGGEPLLSRLGGAETIGLITGSEGGFSPEEAAAPAKRMRQIGLGPRSCVVRPRRWRHSL